MDANFKYVCKIARLYEEKLAELMTKKDYEIFMRDVSRGIRREMIAGMPDGSFKQCLLDLEKQIDEKAKEPSIEYLEEDEVLVIDKKQFDKFNKSIRRTND